MNDRYLKTVLTVIAGALIYLCIVVTPLPGLSAQVPSIRPGEPSGPTEVVIVGWRAADAAFPVAVLNSVRVTASEPLPIRGSVTTERSSSGRADRVLHAGAEGILQAARSLAGFPADTLPESLLERLSTGEVLLVRGIGAGSGPAAPPDDCVKALKRLRYERERGDLQREIDRLQELGAAQHDAEITALWARKKDLLTRIESLH